MIRALDLKGKTKIADDWKQMPYIVKEIPIKDIPVYDVRQEDGKGRVKTLHRNQILHFTCLPSEPLLIAPPDRDRGSVTIRAQTQPNPPISDSSPETESDSTYIGDSAQSGDEAPSSETCRIPMRRKPGEAALHPRRQQRGRPREQENHQAGWQQASGQRRMHNA